MSWEKLESQPPHLPSTGAARLMRAGTHNQIAIRNEMQKRAHAPVGPISLWTTPVGPKARAHDISRLENMYEHASL